MQLIRSLNKCSFWASPCTTVLTATNNIIKCYSMQSKPYVNEIQLGGNWMSHSICCPHATATLIYSKCIFSPLQFRTAQHVTVHLNSQSATGPGEESFPLHWVMLFIKPYRNPVACLSAQSISRWSIMISAAPACCYLVMFGDGLRFSALAKEVWGTSRFRATQLILLTWWQQLQNKNTTANMDDGGCTKQTGLLQVGFHILRDWLWSIGA